ncbi:hypothetical protein J2X12_002870 [Pseudarthrobacter oxydans]|uniref:Uncharacterized protein n=1 Tax=Pseudarthrobacter oxydans TaxID=1671 RepID=A0AAW8NC11_PSEOX|nr:hypothetical protein [Pseudarthrobacter oxydans]MDR6794393.1 hypothetical protein [Pseudarthrobacter oxydans]MDR7164832.1 hypothetical protein [Pseudarthrobacter oxydans]
MAKNIPGSFTTHPTIKHSSGYTFQQNGGRVHVRDENGDLVGDPGIYAGHPIGYVLPIPTLRRMAKQWLAENIYNEER